MTSCKSEQKESKETEVVALKDILKEVTEVTEEEASEELALAFYQCPVDCEQGKIYDKHGSCSVFKINLQKTHKEIDLEKEVLHIH